MFGLTGIRKFAAVNGPGGYQASLANNDYGPLFEQYKVTFGMNLEFIQDTLYDTRTYVSGTTQSLSMFDGTGAGDLSLTNMPGQTLPDRTGFLAMAFTFKPFVNPRSVTQASTGVIQTGTINDLALLGQRAVSTLKLFSKDYSTVPLDLIPAGNGIWGTMAAGTGTCTTAAAAGNVQLYTDWGVNGWPDSRNMYVLEEPLFIPPSIQVQFKLLWPNAAVTLAGGDTRLRFVMHGLTVRPVQ